MNQYRVCQCCGGTYTSEHPASHMCLKCLFMELNPDPPLCASAQHGSMLLPPARPESAYGWSIESSCEEDVSRKEQPCRGWGLPLPLYMLPLHVTGSSARLENEPNTQTFRAADRWGSDCSFPRSTPAGCSEYLGLPSVSSRHSSYTPATGYEAQFPAVPLQPKVSGYE